uniref:Uncharacterized protein n=1 Tax=Magallana gigas TaxID=29159 RepID=K1R8E5_MAGGI
MRDFHLYAEPVMGWPIYQNTNHIWKRYTTRPYNNLALDTAASPVSNSYSRNVKNYRNNVIVTQERTLNFSSNTHFTASINLSSPLCCVRNGSVVIVPGIS